MSGAGGRGRVGAVWRPDGTQLAELVEAAATELADGPDDLAGLLGRLSAGGLREEVLHWMAEGQVTRLSDRALRQAIGDVALERIAARAGLGRRRAVRGLASVLPALVDQLAPHGELLSGDALSSALSAALAELRKQGAS